MRSTDAELSPRRMPRLSPIQMVRSAKLLMVMSVPGEQWQTSTGKAILVRTVTRILSPIQNLRGHVMLSRHAIM